MNITSINIDIFVAHYTHDYYIIFYSILFYSILFYSILFTVRQVIRNLLKNVPEGILLPLYPETFIQFMKILSLKHSNGREIHKMIWSTNKGIIDRIN